MFSDPGILAKDCNRENISMSLQALVAGNFLNVTEIFLMRRIALKDLFLMLR
jgi:hypothetical protein